MSEFDKLKNDKETFVFYRTPKLLIFRNKEVNFEFYYTIKNQFLFISTETINNDPNLREFLFSKLVEIAKECHVKAILSFTHLTSDFKHAQSVFSRETVMCYLLETGKDLYFFELEKDFILNFTDNIKRTLDVLLQFEKKSEMALLTFRNNFSIDSINVEIYYEGADVSISVELVEGLYKIRMTGLETSKDIFVSSSRLYDGIDKILVQLKKATELKSVFNVPRKYFDRSFVNAMLNNESKEVVYNFFKQHAPRRDIELAFFYAKERIYRHEQYSNKATCFVEINNKFFVIDYLFDDSISFRFRQADHSYFYPFVFNNKDDALKTFRNLIHEKLDLKIDELLSSDDNEKAF